MTRGNQRELARAKNLKKQDGGGKKNGKDDGLTFEQRRLRDMQALQEKQKKKQEQGGESSQSAKK